jgi:hypothetical protein
MRSTCARVKASMAAHQRVAPERKQRFQFEQQRVVLERGQFVDVRQQRFEIGRVVSEILAHQ